MVEQLATLHHYREQRGGVRPACAQRTPSFSFSSGPDSQSGSALPGFRVGVPTSCKTIFFFKKNNPTQTLFQGNSRLYQVDNSNYLMLHLNLWNF